MKRPTRIREIQVGAAVVPVHACSSCKAEILWATTTRDKALCLDLKPNEAGVWVVRLQSAEGGGVKVRCFHRAVGQLLEPGEKRRTSHWATCPNADQHRRKADV